MSLMVGTRARPVGWPSNRSNRSNHSDAGRQPQSRAAPKLRELHPVSELNLLARLATHWAQVVVDALWWRPRGLGRCKAGGLRGFI